MAEFHIPQLAQFVDAHLLLPLLDFAEHNKVRSCSPARSPSAARHAPSKNQFFLTFFFFSRQLFASAEAAREARRRVLAATHLYDALLDVTESSGATAVRAKRDKFATSRAKLQAACAPLLAVLDDAALTEKLKRDKVRRPFFFLCAAFRFDSWWMQDFHLAYLTSNFGVTDAHVAALYRFAYAEYTCGQYARASALLAHSAALAAPDASQASEQLWGKLACLILLQQPDEALAELLALKERIELKTAWQAGAGPSATVGAAAAALEKLHRRTWLAHYALFVCFGHANGLGVFLDLCMEEKMLQAIQTVCPHLLRYVGAASVLTRRSRREFLRAVERNDDATLGVSEMVRNAAASDASDRDPVIVFLRRLFVEHDFEAARADLERCSKMIKADFFLCALHDEFVQNARVLLFESYCRLHERIALPALAQKLGMEHDAAELWLVNMIRDARIDAKIDSANDQIILAPRVVSPHQRVIDKTKGLAFRSSVLLGNLDRTRQHKEKTLQAAAAAATAAAAAAAE